MRNKDIDIKELSAVSKLASICTKDERVVCFGSCGYDEVLLTEEGFKELFPEIQFPVAPYPFQPDLSEYRAEINGTLFKAICKGEEK